MIPVRGLVWLGETAVWFRMADGNEGRIHAQTDADHAVFGSGPVVGVLGDDFAASRTALEAQGAVILGEP